MIRRTVAKAFGFSGDERPPMEKTQSRGQSSRVTLLNKFFIELQGALERVSQEQAKPAGGAGRHPEKETGDPEKVSKIRPQPEGLEFLAQGPGGSYRFLNGMDGIVRIYREEEGAFREDRLLAIHFEGKIPRAIEKPVGLSRAPFRFTSVPQLAREIYPEAE